MMSVGFGRRNERIMMEVKKVLLAALNLLGRASDRRISKPGDQFMTLPHNLNAGGSEYSSNLDLSSP
jgi:hypothetical protein